MRLTLRVGALSAALFVHCSSVQALPLANMGFESGLAGYATQGNVSVETEWFSATYLYGPTEGNQFAVLTAEGADTGEFGGTDGAILSTTAQFASGDQFSFDWAFIARDQLPYNDFALFVGDQQYLLADIAAVGDLGTSGWFRSTWTSPFDFSGDIKFVVSNRIDDGFDSILLVDNLSVTSSVDDGVTPPVQQAPEPGTLGLLALGLMGLGGFACRRARV